MNMKKILAAVCAALMLLCVAGCNNAPDTSETPATIVEATPIGSLQLAIEMLFTVTYDDGGLVTALDGHPGASADLAAAYATAVGSACDTVVSTLIQTIVDGGDCPNAKVIVIKQMPDSEVPSAVFLENLRIDAEAAASGRQVILITADQLTADGFIKASTATQILTQHLSLPGANITCAEEPVDGKYTLTVAHTGIVEEYFVDAATGVVFAPEELNDQAENQVDPGDTSEIPEYTEPPEMDLMLPTEEPTEPETYDFTIPIEEIIEPDLGAGE